jgi:starvation-inducible DNA-binding protein
MDREATVAELEPLLIGLTDLALTAKQAHWNLTGPNFRSLHLQLDELAADARGWSDQAAERIVAIGFPADARVETVATLTSLPTFPPGFVDDAKAVAEIVDRLDEMIGRTRPRLHRVGELDLVSQDLLLGIVAGLETHRWMFSAQQGAL